MKSTNTHPRCNYHSDFTGKDKHRLKELQAIGNKYLSLKELDEKISLLEKFLAFLCSCNDNCTE